MAKIKCTCRNCGVELLRFKSQMPKNGNNYCSLSCSVSYRNRNEYNPSHFRDLSGEKNPMYKKGYLICGEKNGMYGKVGKLNPLFKGGRYVRKDGYVRLNIDGKRILEHRLVLKTCGKNIDSLIVHHKNRNKSDNSIENLEILTQSEHIKEHYFDLHKK